MRRLLLLTLALALVTAGTASAGLLGTAEPVRQRVDEAAPLLAPVTAAASDLPPTDVPEPQEALADLTDCQSAVRLTRTYWTGEVTDAYDGHSDFVGEATAFLRELVYRQVPAPTGLLPNAVQDAAPVMLIDEVVRAVETPALAQVDWHAEYVVWTKVVDTTYIYLPVGLPVPVGGTVVTVCDEGIQILETEPGQRTGPYISYMQPTDGWVFDVLTAWATLEVDSVSDPLPIHQSLGLAPSSAIKAAERALYDFHPALHNTVVLGALDEDEASTEAPDVTAPASTHDEARLEMDAASTTVTPVAGGAATTFGLAGVAAALVVAMAMLAMRKRRV